MGGIEMSQETHRGFHVFWSPEDQEWVGLSDAFPSMSHLADTPEAALSGIIKLQQSTALDLLAELHQGNRT